MRKVSIVSVCLILIVGCMSIIAGSSYGFHSSIIKDRTFKWEITEVKFNSSFQEQQNISLPFANGDSLSVKVIKNPSSFEGKDYNELFELQYEENILVYDNETRLFLEKFYNLTNFHGFIVPLTINNTSYMDTLSKEFLSAKSSIDHIIITIPYVEGAVKYIYDENVLSLTISLTFTYLNSTTTYKSLIEYSTSSGFMNRYFIDYDNATNSKNCHFKLDLLNLNVNYLPFNLHLEWVSGVLSLLIITIVSIRRKTPKS